MLYTLTCTWFQVSFGGLKIKVSEEQLHEAGDSMMAVALARQMDITIVQARDRMDLGGSEKNSGYSTSGGWPFAEEGFAFLKPVLFSVLWRRVGAAHGWIHAVLCKVCFWLPLYYTEILNTSPSNAGASSVVSTHDDVESKVGESWTLDPSRTYHIQYRAMSPFVLLFKERFFNNPELNYNAQRVYRFPPVRGLWAYLSTSCWISWRTARSWCHAHHPGNYLSSLYISWLQIFWPSCPDTYDTFNPC